MNPIYVRDIKALMENFKAAVVSVMHGVESELFESQVVRGLCAFFIFYDYLFLLKCWGRDNCESLHCFSSAKSQFSEWISRLGQN